MNQPNCGALWIKQAKNGKKFMAGVIKIDDKEIKIVIFKNERKQKDNQPDYNVMESKPKITEEEFN